MSLDPNSEPYFEIDVIKENIEETGNSTNESKLENWGNESDREIDTELFYLFAPEDFPLSEAKMIAAGFTALDFDKIRKLSNERTEAKFWFKTNGDKTMLETSDEHLKTFVEKLTQIPATTL